MTLLCRERKATQQRWDEEWGRIGREGNLWYLGSYRANWEMVMGKSKLGWIRTCSFPCLARFFSRFLANLSISLQCRFQPNRLETTD